jgi:hypothetical protein
MKKKSLPFLRKNKIAPILTESPETSERNSESSEYLYSDIDIKEFISNAAKDKSKYAFGDLLELLNVHKTSLANNKEIKYAFAALQNIINPERRISTFVRKSLSIQNKVKPEEFTMETIIDLIYEEISKYLDKFQEPKKEDFIHNEKLQTKEFKEIIKYNSNLNSRER